MVAVLVSLSVLLDLTTSFWVTRARLGRGRGRFGRFGRSDPDMIEGRLLSHLTAS